MNETELELDNRPGGVYCWRNLVNGKRYVGSAVRLLKRMNGHLNSLRLGVHKNVHLQRAWNRYGDRKFVFQILERCEPENCLIREQAWINEFDSSNPRKGYNICPTAGSMFGFRHSMSSKEKISVNGKKSWTQDRRTKRSLDASSRVGWSFSQESRLKMSRTRLSKIASGEIQVTGHPQSQETRERISSAHRGKTLSPEHRAKLSAAKKGKPWTVARRNSNSGN